MFLHGSLEFLVFNIYKLSSVGKDTEVVSRCLFRDLEFKVVFLLNRLPPKARDTNLPYYLTNIWKEKW